jgi:hypothetical protein
MGDQKIQEKQHLNNTHVAGTHGHPYELHQITETSSTPAGRKNLNFGNLAPLPHYKNVAGTHVPTLPLTYSTMAIDLNTKPVEESEEPLIPCNTVSSSAMAIDLNKLPGDRSEETLPDLNQKPTDDEDRFDHVSVAQVDSLKGHSHYLQEEQHGGVYAIDLNIAACEGQYEESHEGIVSLSCFIV